MDSQIVVELRKLRDYLLSSGVGARYPPEHPEVQSLIALTNNAIKSFKDADGEFRALLNSVILRALSLGMKMGFEEEGRL